MPSASFTITWRLSRERFTAAFDARFPVCREKRFSGAPFSHWRDGAHDGPGRHLRMFSGGLCRTDDVDQMIRRTVAVFTAAFQAPHVGSVKMRNSRLLILLFALPALAQQLETRPPVLQLSLKKAVEIALSPEGSTRLQLAAGGVETNRSAQGPGSRGAAAGPRRPGHGAQPDRKPCSRWDFNFRFRAASRFHIPAVVGPFNVLDVRASVNQNVFDFAPSAVSRRRRRTVGAAKSDRTTRATR